MAIDIQKQKVHLEAEKEMLLKQMIGLGMYNTETDSFEATHETTPEIYDRDVQADSVKEYQTNSATGSILKERLDDVIAALSKIKNTTYGICEETGEEIEEDRLLVNPAARISKRAMQK
jgi:RNA polymerase-binding transcription factor DksA